VHEAQSSLDLNHALPGGAPPTNARYTASRHGSPGGVSGQGSRFAEFGRQNPWPTIDFARRPPMPRALSEEEADADPT